MKAVEHPIIRAPVNRIILLGASNLTLSLYETIRIMQNWCGSPSEIYVAAGHGRSYGKYSRVLFRGLPGIVDSHLWKTLDPDSTLPTFALITDIGNDIPYGYSSDQLIQWVLFCIKQLENNHAQIVMTNIPWESIRGISQIHFKLMRYVFFPFSKLTREQLLFHTKIVYEQLQDIAKKHNIKLCAPKPDWYGWDLLHIRKRIQVYTQLVENFQPSKTQPTLTETSLHRGKWKFKNKPHPLKREIFNREIYCDQPSSKLRDGSLIFMY